MRKYFAWIVLFFLLAGCITTQQEVSKNTEIEKYQAALSQGISGFTGDIYPIKHPVYLSLNYPINAKILARQIFETKTPNSIKIDTQENLSVFKARKVDGKRELTIEMLEMTVDNQRFKSDVPLIIIEVLVGENNEIVNQSNRFPGTIKLGQELTIREKENLSATIASSIFSYSDNPLHNKELRTGDLTIHHELADMFQDMLPQVDNATGPKITEEVVGKTRVKGRGAVLTKFGGVIAIENFTKRFAGEVTGHAVYDLRTGLTISSLIRMTWTETLIATGEKNTINFFSETTAQLQND